MMTSLLHRMTGSWFLLLMGSLLCGLLHVGCANSLSTNAPIKIALIGDSTACEYPAEAKLRGWGQMLPKFLPEHVEIFNAARGGLSTKTYPDWLWNCVLESNADYLLIQFGHNDSHAKGRPESTDAATDYRDNLIRFIREARAAGIEPILVTPVRRRLFKDGALTSELSPYRDGMYAVAEAEAVKLIDLHELSGQLYTDLGEAGSEAFTPNFVDHADRPGSMDLTHFTETGATAMAALVAKE
ncbi:rhamnogalacturonan acetylesterase [Coraliomargarita sp. SDUM461003]|uniref:Rhamnogalacturonan acetylesterase n=1 Tax=Thalassobacterium maritimum TaxID=3041265 RepID=A0ABU1AUR1_9BACT|nr:rhamnogalacturonan acetylesterase [Coraliomargarita sp. SDUM461003]MDQ8207901.1 rhamnogalacturonan acetylesterase [Coraliomargarita sp. SDUM461003]